MCHVLDHSSIWYKSFCSISESYSSLIVLKSFVSSAKFLTYDSTTEGKSLMYDKNKSGPITLPWGIPLDILAHSDFAEF